MSHRGGLDHKQNHQLVQVRMLFSSVLILETRVPGEASNTSLWWECGQTANCNRHRLSRRAGAGALANVLRALQHRSHEVAAAVARIGIHVTENERK
jgi:hypothetical protein